MYENIKMLKHQYQNLLDNRPWQEMETYFNNLPVTKIKRITTLDINTEDWIKFSLEHFDKAQQKWESPKENHSEYSNKWVNINNIMGRNEHNTFELNYGMNGDTNDRLKELLGVDNIKKLNADADTVLIRFIVKFPGHGVAWHCDDAGSYTKKFPGVDTNKIKRFWFSVDDWRDGHAMQISKTILTHWYKGDVYNIPLGMGHASSNFGYMPQYTVSFTGVIND
jgi:hypothetical protein